MKILRITSLGYVGGGVENGILLLQPVMEHMGHTVKTFASDHNPDVAHWSEYEFPALSNQPAPLKLLYRAWYPQSYVALRRVLEEYQPDVVQVHSVFEVSASVLFALRDYPTVLTVHGAEDYTEELLLWAFPLNFFKDPEQLTYESLTLFGKLHFWYHRYVSMPVFRWGFRNVDRFVVFSAYMQDMMQRQGIESTCVPNSTQLFEPEPIDPASRNILYVGRLEKIKGVQHIIEALPKIAERYPNVTLAIAGSGTYEDQLKTMVRERGLEDRVTFHGYYTRDELYRYLKESTVVVVPSVWPEPFGKVGIEAYSVGRPVIASDVGGISEWLDDGETGYLVEPEAPEQIAEKVQALFADPKRLQQFSHNALQRAKDFSVEEHAKTMCALYEEVVAAEREDVKSTSKIC